MDRYANGGGADRPFWLQAFEGSRWTSDRVKTEVPISHTRPGVFWVGIQPDKLATIMLGGGSSSAGPPIGPLQCRRRWRSTVQLCLLRARAPGLSWPLPATLTDQELEPMLFAPYTGAH
jgi:hypothetical protein